MRGVVFGCIAPHGGMLIPDIGGREGQKALATRAAMEELGRRMAATQPETIFLVTPHGIPVAGAFSLLDSGRVAGELEALERERLREMGYSGDAKKPWEQAIRLDRNDGLAQRGAPDA